MRCLLPVVLCAGLFSCSSAADDPGVSTVKPDERIVFITGDAHRAEDGRSWKVPIHAWVHELEDTRMRKAVFAAVLEKKYGLEATAETAPNFDRRIQLFVVDNEGGKRIVIQIVEQTFALPPTASNGHATAEIDLDADLVASMARDGKLEFAAVLPKADERVFAGSVNLVDRRGISVISDIDDTVKVTGAADRAVMFDRTFFRDFEATPGMAALYTRWAQQGATFHYVSSSPWHLYEPLDAFLTTSGFPSRSLSLKLVRVKDKTLLELFKKGTETKPGQIEPILERFPHRRFILVGDSGEHDPEVYAALLRKYPERIERIYIRNVDDSAPTDERFLTTFASIDPDRWSLFTDPASLELPE